MMSKENIVGPPIVSVLVIAYNSEDYILETLESIKTQTYKNIELIISDDASSDHTLSECRNWVAQNGQHFVHNKIITSERNTGIPGNCNRGIKASSGEWIKIIAADDLLLSNCIEDNVHFLYNNDCEIIISNMIHFWDNTNPKKIFKRSKPFWGKKGDLQTALQQYQALLLSYCGNTTSLFISRKVYEKISYDEDFPFIEDYPFLLNATQNGFYISHLDKETVMYRIRNNSAYFGDDKKLFSDFYLKSYPFDKEYRFPYLSFKRRKSEEYHYKRLLLLDKWKFNKKSRINKLIFEGSRFFNFYKFLMFLNDRKNL